MAWAGPVFTLILVKNFPVILVVGAARSLVIDKNFVIAGLEMLIVGGVAATIAYGLGSWVETLTR